MAGAGRLQHAWKAARQLGLRPVSLYALHAFAWKLGIYRFRTARLPVVRGSARLADIGLLSSPANQLRDLLGEQVQPLLALADEVAAGTYRPFGGEPVPLDFRVPHAGRHWSAVQGSRLGGDIKFLWEPARLGWAFRLIEAYRLSREARYEQSFWRLLDDFERQNLPYRGPNWASGQEAGLRILALAAAAAVFPRSPERERQLARVIAAHAARIPPTLVYARAQENNHLLSEAAGLYTAGLLLRDEPAADGWLRLGWRWFNRALEAQVDPDGVYIQHSTNYHRLMLQLALWMDMLLRATGGSWPAESARRLAAASHWLASRLDTASGKVPNLGHNDGSLILPLAHAGYDDYRPTVQAAGRAFSGGPFLDAGPWDAFSAWLGLPVVGASEATLVEVTADPLRLGDRRSWASLRAQHFHHRPAHADQLHVELWWDGENLLADPGTYRYNDSPPWNNGLASALVHNSVAVDGSEPMLRAGLFLWLDWDQARQIHAGRSVEVSAERDGYRRLGVRHQRALEHTGPGQWRVTDRLLAAGKSRRAFNFRLHWLCPLAADWQLDELGLLLSWQKDASRRTMRVAVDSSAGVAAASLISSGERIAGDPVADVEILGWYSPTYALRWPAFSYLLQIEGPLPVTVQTRISLAEANGMPGEWSRDD